MLKSSGNSSIRSGPLEKIKINWTNAIVLARWGRVQRLWKKEKEYGI